MKSAIRQPSCSRLRSIKKRGSYWIRARSALVSIGWPREAVFVTTPEFLGQHRQQLVTTQQLIARARADGHFRMVEMNERVATNLERIVAALEQQQAFDAS